MIKYIRLLVEGFFDDDIFNIDNDIEDLGRYYDYKVGDIYYLNKKPYAICCGDSDYFKDNKPRFCLLNIDNKKDLHWRTKNKFVKELECFINYKSFILNSFNDFQHIDENGYQNTQIIKNNYDISEFPAFKYCIELGDNIYFPAIDELQIMYLNKDKLSKYFKASHAYWSSTQYSAASACYINITFGLCGSSNKKFIYHISPFFRLD